MWHLFWPSLRCKLSIVSAAIAVLFPQASLCLDTPGLIESLESIVSLHKRQYDKVFQEVEKNPTTLSSISGIKSVKLNRYFVKSVIFYTEDRYMKMSLGDECKFLALLDSGILKSAHGKLNNVIVDIEKHYGKTETALISKDDYLKNVYKNRCLSTREISILFKSKHLKKTVDAINFLIPKNRNECLSIYSDWSKNPYLPYLCAIPEDIRMGNVANSKLQTTDHENIKKIIELKNIYSRGRALKKAIPFFKRNYLAKLCSSLTKPEDFCAQYLADDVWNRILVGEKPLYQMSYKCMNILKKHSISKNELKKCAHDFNQSPNLCTSIELGNFNSLFPRPNCKLTSDALIQARLYTNYQDCPGSVDNQAIINIHRIIAHKKKKELISDQDTCAAQANYSFAKLNIDQNNPKGWPLKICFLNRVSEQKECLPYVPNHNLGSDLDEGKVVAEILNKNMGADIKNKCKVVSDRIYSPHRLKYKNGCFIVYNSKLCTPIHCKKKIIYNNNEIKGIKHEGVPVFDYFPTAFTNEKFSANNLVMEGLKTKGQPIRNITSLKLFFKNNKEGIVHGVGCAGDILPSFFHKRSFQQCIPLPFISDGIVNAKKLVIRTSIDDIHSPRLIPWGHIFNAVAKYRNLHPLSTWTLYGIK